MRAGAAPRPLPLRLCAVPSARAGSGAMLRLRLLTWDVKDTLLRLRQPVGQSYSAEAQAHGLRVQPQALSEAFREAYGAQSRRFPNYGRGQGLSSKQWWLDVVQQTFRLAGVRKDGVLSLMAENLYRDFCSVRNWELLPGAAETLSRCCQRGLRMGVVSNFDNRLEDILAQCDLRQHFEFVLTSEAVGFAKPDRRIFEKALRLGGVLPEQAAHIGDDYTRDYRAAREVGMHSFLLRTARQGGHPEVPPGHVLPTLSHLLALIEKE
ncbi:haloacid dehalogenase-like hydrolase domain-containing protein 3 [Mergus octosetaceus]